MSQYCGLINNPNLKFKSSTVQKGCGESATKDFNNEWTQQELIYSCKDQLCTQVWLTIIEESQGHYICFNCNIKFNEGVQMPFHK